MARIACDGDLAAPPLRLMARAWRAMGRPEGALPALTAWLERYPDAPDAPSVWVDLCQCCVRAGPAARHTLDGAMENVRALLGSDHPVLLRLEAMARAQGG